MREANDHESFPCSSGGLATAGRLKRSTPKSRLFLLVAVRRWPKLGTVRKTCGETSSRPYAPLSGEITDQTAQSPEWRFFIRFIRTGSFFSFLAKQCFCDRDLAAKHGAQLNRHPKSDRPRFVSRTRATAPLSVDVATDELATVTSRARRPPAERPRPPFLHCAPITPPHPSLNIGIRALNARCHSQLPEILRCFPVGR